jgi:hypothetical protein
MDYHNGKIYAIRSHQTEDIYIGSTTTKLSKRLYGHKSNFKKWKNGKYHYVTSFELMKYDDCYIELLQGYSCDSKMELHKREGEFIRSMDCVNKRIAGRTDKEYRDDNKDKKKDYDKEYYEDNKDKKKEYYEDYYEVNKDKIKIQMKEYRETNKEKIKQNSNKKYDCECGGKYTQTNKSQHFKSQKHLSKIPIINVVQELV